MALTQRREPRREHYDGNVILAQHIIKEGKFDRRHIPLIDSIINTNSNEREKASEQFLNTKNYEKSSKKLLCLRKGLEHFELPIKTLRTYGLIEGFKAGDTFIGTGLEKTAGLWVSTINPVAYPVLSHIRRLLISKK